MKDLYKTLGVAEDADDDTIKKAYRKLAKQNHPDATGGDKRKTERFKEIGEAYAVLGRQAEAGGVRPAQARPGGLRRHAAGLRSRHLRPGVRRRLRPRRPAARGGVHVSTDFDGDVGDLFSSLFGGGGRQPLRTRRAGGGPARGLTRGPDMTGVLDVSLREAALGARRTIRSGSGASIEVQIPPGVDTGGRLRLPGQGGAGAGAGRPAGRPASGDPGDRRSRCSAATARTWRWTCR